MNRQLLVGLTVLGTWAFWIPRVHSESIWERRNPYFVNLNEDFRARHVGDVLTVLIQENTGYEGQEKKEMQKETQTSSGWKFGGGSAAGAGSGKKFSADIDGETTSNRKFDGKANSTIERRFTDRMTVVVMGVYPNGNMLVEGCRLRQIGREVRTLRLRGIVRPGDIGPFNTIDSQYVGNFQFYYDGRGPESNFTNQGWGGRLNNIFWPY